MENRISDQDIADHIKNEEGSPQSWTDEVVLDLRDCRAELASTQQALERAADPEVVRMDIQNGKLDMTLRHPGIVMLMAEQFYQLMEAAGADNVLEYSIRHDKAGDITVTLQKKTGKSPMELLDEVKTELQVSQAREAASRAEVERLMIALKASYALIVTGIFSEDGGDIDAGVNWVGEMEKQYPGTFPKYDPCPDCEGDGCDTCNKTGWLISEALAPSKDKGAVK